MPNPTVMIHSMTGYGKVTCEYENKHYTIEIRALNHKQTDVNTRIPAYLREKEMALRNEIIQQLQRGKIDLSIESDYLEDESMANINQEVVKSYYQQLEQITDQLNLPRENYLNTIMRLPNTLKKDQTVLEPAEWETIFEGLREALQMLKNHRVEEGERMEKDISSRVEFIQESLKKIEQIEPSRTERIRQRLQNGLEQMPNFEQIDKERLEQEILYYAEKLDINEEKVRLSNHCTYFFDTLHNKEEVVGKKLNFIAQEMLREINTIGSKASDSDIQQLVVNMKNELEKIKEQIMNVL